MTKITLHLILRGSCKLFLIFSRFTRRNFYRNTERNLLNHRRNIREDTNTRMSSSTPPLTAHRLNNKKLGQVRRGRAQPTHGPIRRSKSTIRTSGSNRMTKPSTYWFGGDRMWGGSQSCHLWHKTSSRSLFQPCHLRRLLVARAASSTIEDVAWNRRWSKHWRVVRIGFNIEIEHKKHSRASIFLTILKLISQM